MGVWRRLSTRQPAIQRETKRLAGVLLLIWVPSGFARLSRDQMHSTIPVEMAGRGNGTTVSAQTYQGDEREVTGPVEILDLKTYGQSSLAYHLARYTSKHGQVADSTTSGRETCNDLLLVVDLLVVSV